MAPRYRFRNSSERQYGNVEIKHRIRETATFSFAVRTETPRTHVRFYYVDA